MSSQKCLADLVKLLLSWHIGFQVMLLIRQIVVCHTYDYDWGPPLNPPPSFCSDYEMRIINTKRCVSRCPIRCRNSVCFEDGICPCEGSYVTSFEHNRKGLTCSMDCLPGCKSAGGYCAAPDLCLCKKGFYFNAVARRCWKGVKVRDRCFGRCLYGTCTENGECICAQGFEFRNNTLLFGQLCVPTCQQDCGRHGFCFLPNMCACKKKHYHYEWDGRCHKDTLYLGEKPPRNWFGFNSIGFL